MKLILIFILLELHNFIIMQTQKQLYQAIELF